MTATPDAPADGASAARLPLEGRERLEEGDVRMMLRAKFWERARVSDEEAYGTCMATATGVRALAGIPASAVAGMRVEDALPQGRASIVATSHGQTEELPVIPALAALLKRWKRIRAGFVPADGSDKLFADRHGGIKVDGRLNRAGAAMGAAKPLWQMLSTYFEDTLDKHPDEFAIEAYEARSLGRGGDQTAATRAAVKELVCATDPFAGATDFIDDDALAIHQARERGTSLKASFDDSTPELREGPTADHPFLAEIVTAIWPSDKCAKAAAREDLYIRHMSEIDRMSLDGTLTSGRAAALFGMSRRSFLKMVTRARKRAGHPPRGTRAPTGPIARPALAAHEADRLKHISEKAWPPELLEREFRQALIAKQAQFVLGLVEAGKVSVAAGAALFRMDKTKFGRMRADLANGAFDHWVDPTPISAGERTRSEEIILREMSGRPEGQTDEQFCRGLRKKFGLRLPMYTVQFIIKNRDALSRKRKPTREVRPLPTAEEARCLEKIASSAMPPRSDAGASFRALLSEHGEFVFRLVRSRAMTLEAAANLFGIGKDRMAQLAALHRDGDLNLALVPPLRPSEYESRRHSIVRELRRRPPDQSMAEFCRVLARKLRIFVMPSAVHYIIKTEREERLRTAAGRKPLFLRGKKAPLSAADRQRLKTIAAAPWATAYDVAELRRRILTEHGSFIMEMLDASRLHNRDAAELLGLDRAGMTVLRSDYRNGIFDHHLVPPAPKRERRTWHRRIAAAYRDRAAGGTDANFIRDFRKQYRPPLTNDDFKRVIARLR